MELCAMLKDGLCGPPVVDEFGIKLGLMVVSIIFADRTTPVQIRKLYPKLAFKESVIMYPARVFT